MPSFSREKHRREKWRIEGVGLKGRFFVSA